MPVALCDWKNACGCFCNVFSCVVDFVVRFCFRRSGVLMFMFVFVLNGRLSFSEKGKIQALEPGDSVVIPRDFPYALTNGSDDVSFLEVTLPANFTTVSQKISPEQLAIGSLDKR